MKRESGRDEYFMRKALAQAKLALRNNEVPIGAIIVNEDGEIVARAYNKIEKIGCQLGHAECLVIQKACKKIGDWRLNQHWLYVTLEPCSMCLGLIELSRLKGVIYGGPSALFGAITNEKERPSYAKSLVIKSGVLETECIELLQQFFGKVRKKGKV